METTIMLWSDIFHFMSLALQAIATYIEGHRLEVISMAIGLVYLWCEYRASILLWIVGIVMPLVDIVLYWQNGLYADSAMDGYYALAAVYGFIVWKWGKTVSTDKQQRPITHFPLRLLLPVGLVFLAVWAAVYVWLCYLDSTVPVCDSFVNALCIVGMWALSRKYLEQWYIWMVVDIIKTALYAYKGIPVKGSYYALSVVIAIMGYRKWRQMMVQQQYQ